jgi:glucose-6-phosphate 1-epimerase
MRRKCEFQPFTLLERSIQHGIDEFMNSAALGLSHPSGARAAVHPDGSHLFTWWPARGSEVLFMSERVERKRGSSPHGGVPIIFPQFADTGPYMRHGFARTTRWVALPRDSMTTLSLALRDSEATRALWPHAFSAEYTVTLDDMSVSLELGVTNTDDQPFHFTCALHTYLRVGDVYQVALRGLEGCRYNDKEAGGEKRIDSSPHLIMERSINRVYRDTPASLSLEDPVLGRTITVEASGFTDSIIWNPGELGVLEYADLAPGDHAHFLCVESGRVVTPVSLEPGEGWVGKQVLRV